MKIIQNFRVLETWKLENENTTSFRNVGIGLCIDTHHTSEEVNPI
jgi:hypothetical protein